MLMRGMVWSGQAPSLSITETLFEPALTTDASGRPSPLKSAMTTDVDEESPVAVVIGRARLPSPLPRRTLTAPPGDDVEFPLATTRSSLPSLSTSLVVADWGPTP